MRTVARFLALLVILAGTAWSLNRWIVDPLRCERAAWQARRSVDAAEGDRARAVVVAREALASLDRCDGMSAGVLIARAGAASAEGNARAAAAEYQHLLTLERRPETYFALGMAQLDVLDRPAAIENLARACAFDPARLRDIPYDDVRAETAARVRGAWGADWLP